MNDMGVTNGFLIDSEATPKTDKGLRNLQLTQPQALGEKPIVFPAK